MEEDLEAAAAEVQVVGQALEDPGSAGASQAVHQVHQVQVGDPGLAGANQRLHQVQVDGLAPQVQVLVIQSKGGQDLQVQDQALILSRH